VKIIHFIEEFLHSSVEQEIEFLGTFHPNTSEPEDIYFIKEFSHSSVEQNIEFLRECPQ